MTSVSHQVPLPSQAQNTTSAPTQSYANTVKKAVSSPPIATGSSTPSPAVAVGGPAPVRQHAKNDSLSPVNGRTSIPPAVPSFSTPAIVNSSSATNGTPADHGRKSSVTISANGPSSYINGGPVGGSKAGIQFGSITDSPAISHSTPQPLPATTSAAITIANSNGRVPSPAQSPSPIPQPAASGGRPPSGLSQQNNMTFGSMGVGDGDHHMRHASAHRNPTPPTHPQAGHIRRGSSQSMHNDGGTQGPSQTRAGYGRGRNGFNHNHNYQQQLGYPNQYRPHPQGRGMPNQGYQNQSFQNSPHQAARSPAMQHATPGTPNMNQSMPMPQPYGAYGYPNPTMGPPHQVHESSTFTQQFPPFKSTRGGRGGAKKWNEKSSTHWRSQEAPKEQFGHNFPSQPAHAGQSHNDHEVESAVNGSSIPGHVVPGQFVPVQHINALGPAMNMEKPSTFTDTSFPPLPSRIPSTAFEPLTQEPAKIDYSPENGNFEAFLMAKQAFNNPYSNFPPPYDHRMMGMGGQGPMMYPHQPYMAAQAPPSPASAFNQPPTYTAGSYAPQGTPMSRDSSAMSEQRPSSGIPPPQTPVVPSHSQVHTTTMVLSPSFQRKPRVSAAIAIKRPDGELLNVENLKAPNSPALNNQAKTSPVIASIPTPPPPKVSTPQLDQHEGKDSTASNAKTSDQIKSELAEKVQAVAKTANSTPKDEQGSKAEDVKAEEEEAKVNDIVETATVHKSKDDDAAEAEAAAKAAAEKTKQDEDEEMERQIREMEEAEAEREKKEEETLAKRAAEKAVADKANEQKRKLETEENDRKLREAEREMERLEDERERKRLEAEAKEKSSGVAPKKEIRIDVKGEKVAPNTQTTSATKVSNLTLGTDSEASTPASDDAMGPPPPKGAAAEKRGKPAALNLAPLNTKPVEPPQPSAALQSLKSARFLTHIMSTVYPPNVNSPNPAISSAVTTKGKSFKYDKEFLLQFKQVFTEKPSMEFESQIKALIGDGDGNSARPGGPSRGTPAGLGPRGSNRNVQSSFNMGQFNASGVRTLPPGTTSDQRLAMSTGSMARPTVNPMASFNRPGGAFPGGNPMSRTPSTSGMNTIPHSPRQQSRSTRGNSKRENFSGNAKAEAAAAKTMPLTAGMDLKPIQVSSSGWKPRSVGQNPAATGAAGPAPGALGLTHHMEPDMVQRKVKAALNKMTPEKFDKIADQILTIAAQSKDEVDGRTLRQVIQLTFEKATDEAHWASMYAKFCKRMLETMSPDIKDESILDKNGQVVCGGILFRKYLLNRCQEDFERGWSTDLPEKPEGERGEEKTEEAVMLSDEYYIAAAAKRRGLGLVQFIGELYKLNMLTERIMHACVKKLVDYTGVPDEAEIESLTKLLKTIGADLDSTDRGVGLMDVYFTRISAMIKTPELSSRMKFMLMDMVDLRQKKWRSKEANKGPKTLDEVRVEAEAAVAQKAAESARSNQRGGGRMQMGRGDGRNFSNQYTSQPPPDYSRNTVGMDDLRRLTNKGASNRNTSTPMSFGPTSMFSSRSNSGRKMGPGGSLGRTGEESGTSSRTGTPPQQKEKESTTSANAFSLLAGLGSGETENPASPPSTSVSPALAKVTPAKADDKKESGS